jgi:hypothetical protein
MKKTILELSFFIVLIYVIPEIDATYITPRMKESGLRMEIQCHDDPKNCWIQKEPKHERMAVH